MHPPLDRVLRGNFLLADRRAQRSDAMAATSRSASATPSSRHETSSNVSLFPRKRRATGCQLTLVWSMVILILLGAFFGVAMYLHGQRHLRIPVFDAIGRFLLYGDADAAYSGVPVAPICESDVTKNPRSTTVKRAAATSQRPRSSPDDIRLPDVCSTPPCIRTAARIVSAINTSADPCQDFYEFACGGWRDKARVPEGRDHVNAFSHVERETERFFADTLSAAFSASDPLHVSKAKTFYRSCMDEAAIEEKGMALGRELIRKVGGMNLTGDWGRRDSDDSDDPTRPRAQPFHYGADGSDPRVLWRRQFHQLRAAAASTFEREVEDPLLLADDFRFADSLRLRGGGGDLEEDQWLGFRDEEADRRRQMSRGWKWRDSVDVVDAVPDLEFESRSPRSAASATDFRPFALLSAAAKPKVRRDSSSSSFDLTSVASNLILLGVFPLFDLSVIVDPRDSLHHALQIRPWDPWKLPSLPPALLRGGNGAEAVAFYNVFCDRYREIFTVFAGVPVAREKACRYVDANRMRLLIQPTPKSVEMAALRDAADESFWHRYTIDDLQTKFMPALDWIRLLSSFMPFNYFMSPETKVYISSPKYLMRANSFLKFWTREEDTLNDFLMTELLLEIAPLLPQRMRDAREKLHFAGPTPQISRSRKCVSYSKYLLGQVLASMYVKAKVGPDVKEQAERLVDVVRDAFVDNLRRVNWMSSFARSYAEEKARAMTHKVAYPLYLLNDTLVDRLTRSVPVRPEKFFKNMIDARVLRKVSQFSLLARKPSKRVWPRMPYQINAYYSPTRNQFSIMAAILNDPYFDPQLPNYLNFGGVGKVIGHEIAHGFDNDGGRYDKDGNLRPWWSPSDAAFFHLKSRCFADQYSAKKVFIPAFGKSYPLDGNYTLTENVADRVGVKVAYAAYRKWAETRGVQEPLLPGIAFDRNQLFFLSSAQISCSLHRPWSLLERIAHGKHTPDQQRVNGFLMNSPEFSRAFQCPVGSRMNPADKCEMW